MLVPIGIADWCGVPVRLAGVEWLTVAVLPLVEFDTDMLGWWWWWWWWCVAIPVGFTGVSIMFELLWQWACSLTLLSIEWPFSFLDASKKNVKLNQKYNNWKTTTTMWCVKKLIYSNNLNLEMFNILINFCLQLIWFVIKKSFETPSPFALCL